MTQETKTEIIQSLNEADLREKVLIPLFTKMGFIDPILHHHANEKGKDIILKEIDTKFSKTYYLSVVVKAGDVTGSSSGSSSYFALINQIKQSLNEPYKHIYELKEVFVDQVIIVISGKFLPTSLESIYGTLKAERLDKSIREPLDINKLLRLIDEHFSEYWDEYNNETKALVEQRNYLLNNLGKLSKVLFPDIKDQELFLQKVSRSDYEIELFPYKSVRKYIANIGYKSINIDEVDDFFTDPSISNGYADIKKYFFEIKEKAKKTLYEIDEVVEILKAILEEKNPEKAVELTMDLESYVGGGYGRNFQFSTNDIEQQEEFYYGLKEYRNKKEHLIEQKALEFYNQLFDIVAEKTEKELKNFYNEHPKEDKDTWLGFLLTLDLKSQELIELKYYKFQETPKIIQEDSKFGRASKEIERMSIINSTQIKVEIAINNYGFWKDEEYTNEMKAKTFLWHYQKAFEKMFLEMTGLSEE
ncbi:MAG TPA: hypothetical protein DCQ50_09120 [Chryseobacterium sp.]|nr:hypothetical protein [Chryseobacterium sp.]